MSILESAKKVAQVDGLTLSDIPYQDYLNAQQPMIVKGVAMHWPLVQAGLEGAESAFQYLAQFYNDRPLVLYSLAPEFKGQPFYDETLTGMNYTTERVTLDTFRDYMNSTYDQDNANGYYMGSTDQEAFFPGLGADNNLGENVDNLIGDNARLVSLWMGGRTTARAHYDMSNNIAICVAGRRRFILFPPDQIHNLYPGPLAPTPGGQVVSMVDINHPDLEKYPNFSKAIEKAFIADLEPGDLLIYPALWWHQVEAKAEFNILMNYWWNDAPAFADSPMTTIMHAMLSLRDRTLDEKQAWREVFEYYIFGDPNTPISHLPEQAHGFLKKLDPQMARQLRAMLLQKLNR